MIGDILEEFLNPDKSDVPPFFEPGWNVWIWLGMWALLALCAFIVSFALVSWSLADSLYGAPSVISKIAAVLVTLAAIIGVFMLPFKMLRHTDSWGTYWGAIFGMLALAGIVYYISSHNFRMNEYGIALFPAVSAILLGVLTVIALVVEAFTKFAGSIPTSVAGLLGFIFLVLLGGVAYALLGGNRSRA